MIKIIGTTHLMSQKEIESIINIENPSIICIELCETRFNLLQQQIQQPQEDTSILGKISNAIKKKAQEQKLEYGSDMISAGKIALERNIPLNFIDLDIYRIQELMQKIPQNEQQGFLLELQKFEQESLSKEIDEEKTLLELKTKFPIAYEFLITIRELTILCRLLKIESQYKDKKILVFLGKGHKKSIENALSKNIGLKGGKI